MSQQIINISTPDDGLGDALRNGFDKTNQNFSELYNSKVDKITGKGLSENDFTDSDKTKLDGIEAGAQVNVQADAAETDPLSPSYIRNLPPSLYSAVGHFHYSDLATQTTPLAVVANVAKKLTNDTLGANTELDFAPYAVPTVWDEVQNSFDFSNLDLGDSASLRLDLAISTTSANQTIELYLIFGVGTPSEYILLIDSWNEKSTVTFKHFLKTIDFSIDNQDWQIAPAELFILSDANASVKVNGFYIPIIRKSVNIIDFNSDPLKLDKSSTPSSVYTTDAEGLQVMKPISEFQTPGDYVTVNTAQTVDGNKTFNDVGLIKKNQTYLFPNQSGGLFYIGDDGGNDSFYFYSLDGTDQNSFGTVQIYSNPEEGNTIYHNSLDYQDASYLNVKKFDLSLINSFAGQQTALYVDGQTDKITIEGTQNKFAALGTSLITGTKNFEFPNNSGTLALLSDLTDTQNALNLKLSIESPSTTGTVISFTNDKVYGTLTTPETGNITADVTNAKLGVTNIIIHNSVTAPTFGSQFKKLSGSGNYATGVVNYIYCTYISATEIIYSINQRA